MSKRRPGNWNHTKKKWKALNLPDADGYYECWICHKPVHLSIVSLDHVAPVEQYPEYAHELSNLRPSHTYCNGARVKGFMKKINRKIHRRQ